MLLNWGRLFRDGERLTGVWRSQSAFLNKRSITNLMERVSSRPVKSGRLQPNWGCLRRRRTIFFSAERELNSQKAGLAAKEVRAWTRKKASATRIPAKCELQRPYSGGGGADYSPLILAVYCIRLSVWFGSVFEVLDLISQSLDFVCEKINTSR